MQLDFIRTKGVELSWGGIQFIKVITVCHQKTTTFLSYWFSMTPYNLSNDTLTYLSISNNFVRKKRTLTIVWPSYSYLNKEVCSMWASRIEERSCKRKVSHVNSLGKWNFIMYANVTVSLTLVSNKLNCCHFLHFIPTRVKIELLLNVNLKTLCQNCQ